MNAHSFTSLCVDRQDSGSGRGRARDAVRQQHGKNGDRAAAVTQALSCEKTRQGPTLHHANTSLEGIQKQNHMAKPRGQKIQKIQEDAHLAKRCARNKGESNQASTR